MRIAILGAGAMGCALARRWADAGHRVALSFARDPAALARRASEVGAEAASVGDAVKGADVVLFAARWPTLDLVLAQAGPLTGRVLLDCSNPMNEDDTDLVPGESGGATLARRTGARVVKIFNTIPAELLQAPRSKKRFDVLFATDDENAKEIAIQLAHGASFDPVLVGPLSLSGRLESFALLVAQLAYEQGDVPELGYRFRTVDF
jgi:predicted dinucleotide-binding enzyme